jgi:hypothetical protein
MKPTAKPVAREVKKAVYKQATKEVPNSSLDMLKNKFNS